MANTLSDLTTTIATALSNLPPPDQIQDAERMQLLGVLGQLHDALEPPLLSIQRLCLSVCADQIGTSQLIHALPSPVLSCLVLTNPELSSRLALWYRRDPDRTRNGGF